MKKKGKQKREWMEDKTEEMSIETLTEIQGGIEDDKKEVPAGSCGLGCYQGAGGGSDEPTGNG